jgi:hypothetical protein
MGALSQRNQRRLPGSGKFRAAASVTLVSQASTDSMNFWWFGDLLDQLNGRKYKTGKELPRPSVFDVLNEYEREANERIRPDIERAMKGVKDQENR